MVWSWAAVAIKKGQADVNQLYFNENIEEKKKIKVSQFFKRKKKWVGCVFSYPLPPWIPWLLGRGA